MTLPIKLRYGRGVVLEPFLNRVYGERHLRHLVLVSPWITHLTFKTGNTRGLLLRLAASKTRLTVVTRSPAQDNAGQKHQGFLDAVCGIGPSEIMYVPCPPSRNVCQFRGINVWSNSLLRSGGVSTRRSEGCWKKQLMERSLMRNGA